MKLGGKKIPRGNILLFLSFAGISLSLLLIVSAMRVGRANALSQKSLYTGHQKSFSISCAEESQWEDVLPGLMAQQGDFAIYLPLPDSEIILRGIALQGSVETPPMLEGDYFDSATSWTEQPRVVLGRELKGGAAQRDGKMYYQYGGIEFEVLGIMGVAGESRLNHMALIDFRSAVWLAGINTSYVLDTKKESQIVPVGRDMYGLFQLPANVMILLVEGQHGTSFLAQMLSSDRIMDTLYVLVIASFSLSTVLVASIWLRFRRQLFFAWLLFGYGTRPKALEISKRFFLSAGAGFCAGLLMMAAASLAMPDIQMATSDIFQAFVITVGLGAVILLFCCLMEKRS